MNEDTVRAAMATMQSAISELSSRGDPHAAPDLAPLSAAWQRLVGAMALGPAPHMRDCPRCGRAVRAGATLCGYCWVALSPTE